MRSSFSMCGKEPQSRPHIKKRQPSISPQTNDGYKHKILLN